MATKVRFTTQGDVPRFVHGGLDLNESWTEIDLDTATDTQRQAITDYAGRFVRVHPDDMDAFKSYLSKAGLEYTDEGRVRDPKAEERKRQEEEAQRTAALQSPAAGRAGAQPATGSGDAANFQQPPGTDTTTRSTDSGGRDRDATTTDPAKPSTMARGTDPKARGR